MAAFMPNRAMATSPRRARMHILVEKVVETDAELVKLLVAMIKNSANAR